MDASFNVGESLSLNGSFEDSLDDLSCLDDLWINFSGISFLVIVIDVHQKVCHSRVDTFPVASLIVLHDGLNFKRDVVMVES